MAEEPQPSGVHEGIDPDANPNETSSGSADSKKAAAALSSLDARSSAAHDDSNQKPPSAADQKALGDAMSRLELLDGGAAKAGAGATNNSNTDGTTSGEKSSTDGAVISEREQKKIADRAAKEKEAEERRKVKVDAADVALLVEELELSKIRATELLKAARGDAVKAMTDFIKAGA